MTIFIPFMIFSYSNPSVVPVYARPVMTFIVMMVGSAYPGIRPSIVVIIRTIVSIAHRIVISAVRSGPYLAVSHHRPYKIIVIGSVNIIPVIYINVAGTIVVKPSVIIIYP